MTYCKGLKDRIYSERPIDVGTQKTGGKFTGLAR